MDKNPFVSKLNKSVPGAVLETRRFGRSSTLSVWVEAQSILKVASMLTSDSEFKLNWLENLSIVEFEKVFVVTYFVRSTATKYSLVLRISAVPETKNAEISFPSIQSIWPMGKPFEEEAEEIIKQNRLSYSVRKIECEQLFEFGLLAELYQGFSLKKYCPLR